MFLPFYLTLPLQHLTYQANMIFPQFMINTIFFQGIANWALVYLLWQIHCTINPYIWPRICAELIRLLDTFNFKFLLLSIISLNRCALHRPLARYVKLRVAHAPGIPGTFSPPPRFSDPDMHHITCRDACRDLLTSDFLWSRWRGKLSRHSRRMCNPQFYVSAKGPMTLFKMVKEIKKIMLTALPVVMGWIHNRHILYYVICYQTHK